MNEIEIKNNTNKTKQAFHQDGAESEEGSSCSSQRQNEGLGQESSARGIYGHRTKICTHLPADLEAVQIPSKE